MFVMNEDLAPPGKKIRTPGCPMVRCGVAVCTPWNVEGLVSHTSSYVGGVLRVEEMPPFIKQRPTSRTRAEIMMI